MTKIVYKIVEHADGWAYQVDGTYSETFTSHAEARSAALAAAREQSVPDKDVGISFEDASGRWHEELSRGDDRPEASLSDKQD